VQLGDLRSPGGDVGLAGRLAVGAGGGLEGRVLGHADLLPHQAPRTRFGCYRQDTASRES
jgi:hypothetical protein